MGLQGSALGGPHQTSFLRILFKSTTIGGQMGQYLARLHSTRQRHPPGTSVSRTCCLPLVGDVCCSVN